MVQFMGSPDGAIFSANFGKVYILLYCVGKKYISTHQKLQKNSKLDIKVMHASFFGKTKMSSMSTTTPTQIREAKKVLLESFKALNCGPILTTRVEFGGRGSRSEWLFCSFVYWCVGGI